MTKLLFTLGVITLGLFLGYSIQWLVTSRRLILPLPMVDLQRLLQKDQALSCLCLKAWPSC